MDETKQKLLESRADLEILLDRFYGRVKEDPLIGPIFNEVAQVNWEEHVPKIYDFWDDLLFGAQRYRGRPFPPHVPLGLKEEHFRRWLELFCGTTRELYYGLKADEIQQRALLIGRNFLGNLARIEAIREERTTPSTNTSPGIGTSSGERD